jgi:general secretion pathway protein J
MGLRPSGFTLVELLVALIILTLLSVAGFRGLNSVLQTHEHITQETRKWQHLAFFFSRLEQDVAQAIHRPARDPGGLMQPEWMGHPIAVGEDDAELTLTRAGIPNEGASLLAPQRIGYRLEQNTIQLLRWPALDQAPLARPTHYPLLEGVREFRLRHLDAAGQWNVIWPPGGGQNLLPQALEVTVTLTSGETITRVFALQ